MAFVPRLNVNDGFIDSHWCEYAVARTGVYLPNCFTYATARQSEILGYYQPLDEPNRINGAQDLLTKHTSCYKVIKHPVPGCLIVFKGGAVWEPALGRYVSYGHVSNCEAVYSDTDVVWSQSNYGGNLFEVHRGNPDTFYNSAGITLSCYLIHEDLLKENKGEATMYCIFKIIETGKEYYFDGVKAHEITNPDEKVILQEIYKANNGKDMPYKEWSTKAPWYYRLCKPGENEAKF